MESSVWQQNPVLANILNEAHRYHFHQLVFLLEQLLPGDVGTDRIRFRPDSSLAFPSSDVRRVTLNQDQQVEVLVRFMGLYGVDSPLPQYFLDDVTEGGSSGDRLGAFLDIFNQRLYQLLHQVWKKKNLFTSLDETGLYHRLISGMTGQYWNKTHDAMAFGGSFLGQARDVESIEHMLRDALSLEELDVDPDVVTWIAVEDGLVLDGTQALGLETCLGDALPVIGRKVGVKIGPVDQETSQSLQPNGDIGEQMANLLKAYLPEGVDFDVEIELTPKIKHAWMLGNSQSVLAVHTQLGDSTGHGLKFQLSSEQYLHSASVA